MKNKQEAKRLILNLQDAGITSAYINLILKTVQEENIATFRDGWKSGKEEARETFTEKLSHSENYNTQYLTAWTKKAKL
jgi:hypothetical protein